MFIYGFDIALEQFLVVLFYGQCGLRCQDSKYIVRTASSRVVHNARFLFHVADPHPPAQVSPDVRHSPHPTIFRCPTPKEEVTDGWIRD